MLWQSFPQWLQRLRRPHKPLPIRRPRPGRSRLQVEVLEDRVTPACVNAADPPPPVPFPNSPPEGWPYLLEDSTGAGGIYYVTLPDDFSLADAFAIVEAINEDPAADFRWSIGAPDLPFYIVTYVGVPCDDHCPAATTGTAAGQPIFVAAGREFAGVAATFEITSEEFRGEDDFTAEISWGDGSSTQGAVVQVGAGMFEVQGQHTYGLDGVYVMNVTIARTEPDCENDPTIWTTTAVAPALVFGLRQPESLQTIDWTTASITGGEEPDGQSGTGTYRYELHYAVQELYQHTHRDVSGWITFDELSFVAGESTTVRASAGEIPTEYLTTYADLDAKYTRIGTDRYELNRLERDVNLETGTFSGAEEGVVTAQWRDDGKTVAGQQRLDNGAFRLPGHVHDLVGAFGANVEQTIGFARSEGGDFAAESYSRTDTRTINVTSWTVEGSDLLGDYEGTVTQDEIVDRVATAGAIGGAITVAQQYDYAAFDGTTHYELTWEDPVLGVDLELTEDDRVTFQRNVTADLAAHRYESKETRAIHYLAALTGSFAGDDVDLDPEVQTQRVINVTGDAQSGAYTRTTEFPQNQGPAVTDYEGEGYDWQLTERNLRHVETGNYLQRTFTSEESREVTVDAVETVSGAEGPPVEVRLRAVDQRSVSAAGNFNDAVARTTKHAISDAQLTTTGIVDDHTLSDMSVLAARFITAVKGGPGVLKLFQSQARTYDGVPLPIGAKREITIPSINFEAAVYGDLTGTFIIAGFRTAAAATISAGFNDPFYAVMAELKGSVEVFAQIGNAALGGTYLEVNVGAAFNYYKELANPRSLGDLSNLLPETLRNLDLSRARELLSQLPISSLGKPPTQLEGAPAPEGVQGEQHLQDAKLRSEVDQAALADAQGRLTQTPTPLDFSKIAGFSSVPVPPPTVASQLPTRSITAYQLSFTVGLKIGNKIVDALNKTIGSVAYLKAGLEYNFIDHYDEKTQWFDSEGVVIQERTVERNGTSTDVTVEGRVGLEGRLEVGATYVPLHQGEFTTTTVETNQTHKSVTVETSKESGSSLSFFAIVDGKENSVAQSTNTATIIRDVTITNASQSDYRLTRHEEETTNTSSTVVTAFGLVGFSAATGKSRAVSEELEVNQTQTTKVNETSNERWTSTRLSTGLTGSYSETSRREGDYALSRRLTNQSLTVLRTENGSYSSDGTSEGNQLVGLTYDTTETEKSSYTATELETNGPDVVARTEKGSETGTWRSTGRSTAGEYRVALAGPSSARVEIGEVQTNHTLRVERTITRDTETVAYLEVGNQQTGVYVLNDEEKATVVIHEESFNQDAATISDHRTETTTSMADVGNSIGGAYDLRVTETTTLGRSSSTYSNRGHTIESERLIVQGSSQQREIGNAVTGDYEITGGSSESFRETVTDSNRGRIVGRTVTGDESGDNTETGNDLTGVYIASDNYTGGTTTGSTETILDLLVGL